MKKSLTSSFLALMLFQTTAESKYTIRGENYDSSGAIPQMRSEGEIQIERRVSEFREYYRGYSQNPQFAPLVELSRIFDVALSTRNLLNNDINNTNLTNPEIMFIFIQRTVRQLINSPIYKNFDYENPAYRRLHVLIERLDPICRHFRAIPDQHS